MEDAGALVLRLSDPTKPLFRMVNRTSRTLVFQQDPEGFGDALGFRV